MSKRMLQNLDWMFRHFTGYLVAQFFVILLTVTLVSSAGGTPNSSATIWAATSVLTGGVIGSLLCYYLVKFLKGRYHHVIIAKLQENDDLS